MEKNFLKMDYVNFPLCLKNVQAPPGLKKWRQKQYDLNKILYLLVQYKSPSEILRKSKAHTAVSRKVVGRNVHATILKGNMGYDKYTVRNDWSCQTYFCWFLLVLTNICPWPPVPFFQISLKNSALKATHNTFRDCCKHFFDNLSRNSCIRYNLSHQTPS